MMSSRRIGGSRITARTAQTNTAVDAALDVWRRKATDIVLTVSAIVMLPVLALGLLGYAIPASWIIKVLGLMAYLPLLSGVLARRLDYRVRVWVMVGVGYLFALFGSAAFPQAPFLRMLPFAHAVCVLVLTGEKAGRIATLISIGVTLLVPVLHATPGMVPLLTGQGAAPSQPLSQLVVQSINIAALMIGLMLLLDRFHAKLLHALSAQQQATDDLQRESAERAEALRALEHAIAERRHLELELSRIGDEERRRLGQDVHDGVCQQLTGALLRCQVLERQLTRGEHLPAASLSALSALLEEAIDEAHAVAQGLQPLEEEPDALVNALRALTKRTQAASGLAFLFTADGETAMPDPAVAQHLYRIAQEAVSNAVRHARAEQIYLTLTGADNVYTLQIEDDGGGLPSAPGTGGLGMRTMAYRAEIIGGTLAVDVSPHGGVRITCRAPVSSRTDTGQITHVY
jgi:signal transduction histidine kinase